ncbi:endo-alpha-N-acetylgalactosaminidase family protein [Lachnospiraceae bacterium 29-84]
MKKRSVTKLLSCVLAFTMVVTAAPVTAWASEVPVAAEEVIADMEAEGQGETESTEDTETAENAEATEGAADADVPEADPAEAEPAETPEAGNGVAEDVEETLTAAPEAKKTGRAVPVDGINDAWAIDAQTKYGDDVKCEIDDTGFLHLKAGVGNNNMANDAAKYPAVFLNPKTFDFTKEGFFEFQLCQSSLAEDTRFGVYLDYTDPGNGMFLGYDNSTGWFWQKYKNGDGAWYQGSKFDAPVKDQWVPVRIDWTADGKFSLTVSGETVFDKEASGLEHRAEGKIGFKCAGWQGEKVTDVYLTGIYYTGQDTVEGYHITGKVVDEEGNPIPDAKVAQGGKTVQTGEDGRYDLEVLDGKYTIKVSKDGYRTVSADVTVDGANVAMNDIVLPYPSSFDKMTLKTDAMEVLVAKEFPSIVQYNMKGDLQGKTFYGQINKIETIKINDVAIEVKPEDVQATFTDTTATYVISLKNEDAENANRNIDCVITAEIKVEGNTASFDITKVENKLTEVDANGYAVSPVQTIEIPNHSLISVNSTQENAHLKGAKMSSNTMISGDRDFDVVDGMKLTNNAATEDFMYGFISNKDLSAGLWSNSEYQGTYIASAVLQYGGVANTRVMATASEIDDKTWLGLASTRWYYDRKVSTDVITGRDENGGSTRETRTYVVDHEIMPSAKVVIAGDENKDNEIDWQDGAVAFRSIMHNPFKSEEVPELVNYRIAMNFGSQAANPFLMNLDGVKRVYLNTEGLGQGVLLKGYGSEGHDSGHPDYADIGRRIGGADDMNKLLVEGKKMGALFGIHVNASEMYTEAKAYSDELSYGNFGWNWIDQGIGINSRVDLATGARENRFKELFKKVGNNLDFIYVDVWGNCTSGAENEDAWASRMLAREITNLGWRFTTEWGPTQEYDSTLQHWAADLAYGGAGAKGENSVVMRFLRNHQKDSWVADYPSYRGAAMAPLLGGLNMTDFEGWQGRVNFKNYITVMFRHNLITKYLQHYQVVDWVDGEPVAMQGGSWTPEMQITLRNTEDASDNTEVVVSRKSNDYTKLADYRSRTIKLNGVTISEGAVTGGDGSNAGNEKYLIPWNWDSNGEELADADLKMYHWNTKGGDSTWTLTDAWSGLENVVLYKLTDRGRTDKKVIPVVNNQITLEGIEAEIPYVIFKGEKAPLAVNWQTSEYVYDTGFNDPDITHNRTITGEGTAEIADSAAYNHMLKLEGNVSVSQTLTNLKKGQKYALYVGVDNRSTAKAHVTVSSNGKMLASNYATLSSAQNYVQSDQHHTNSGGATIPGTSVSYFQNMYVFFVADRSTATLTFEREAGEGATYFDDIRVVETQMDVAEEMDEEGRITVLFNDFENNAQGIWPFVISSTEGVQDNRIHLSERHDRYTQAGYISKKVDDVLDGNWSVKVNGLSQRNNLIYQTVPQNFRFEPGQKYYVSFDYQMGSDGAYELRLGDGTNRNVQSWTMPEAAGKTGRFGVSFTAGESGENWIGIYSTTKETKSGGYSGGLLDFSGYKDFILDNLRIEKAQMAIDVTNTEKTSAKDKISLNVEFLDKKIDPNTKVTWTSSNEDVAKVNSAGEVYFVGYGSALINATAVINGKEVTLSSRVYLEEEYQKTATFTNVWANSEQPSGGEGKENAIDRSPSTIWHVAWNGFSVSETNPAIITVRFEEDITEFESVAFQQRPSGSNGFVQKYECVVGSGFDAATHTITGTVGTDKFTTGTVTTKQPSAGKIETLTLPEGTKGNYLQIRVLQGSNNFASLADILIDTTISYNTPEEQGYLEANEESFQIKDLEEEKEMLGQVVEEATSVFNGGGDSYSYEAWAVFKAAYEEAQKVQVTGTPEEIRAAKELLAKAQENLKELSPEEKELDDAKQKLWDAIEAVREDYEAGRGNYTYESWTAFKDAYIEAVAVAESSNDLSEVVRMETTLLYYHDGLRDTQVELETARRSLKLAILKADKVERGNYSDATWEDFEAALNAAKLGVDSTSISKLNRLEVELKAAQAALKEAEDPEPGNEEEIKTAQNELKAAVDAAKAIIDTGSKDYTKESWEAFEAAYDEARLGQNSTNVTKLNRLKNALTTAQANLVPKEEVPDPGVSQEVKDAQNALKNAIATAKTKLDAGKQDYTDASWEAFEVAYDEARAGVNSTILSKLNRLKKALEDAQSKLEKKGETPDPGVDQEVKAAQKALQDTVDAVKAVLDAGKKNYTDASWEALEAAYDAAKAGVGATSVTTLNRLRTALTTAQSNLKESSNSGSSEINKQLEAARNELDDAVRAATAILAAGKKNYTDASWEAFEEAYGAAVEGRASNSLSKLNRVKTALTAAQKALKENQPVSDKLRIGDTIEVGGVCYKVTSVSGKTAIAAYGTNKKATTINIASTVKIKGVTCKVTKIESEAFKGFKSLKKVTIGSNVTSVRRESFAGCTKLTEVSFGKKVSNIGKKAFYGCKKLKKVIFLGSSVKTMKYRAFKNTNSKISVTLPKGISAKKRNSMKSMIRRAGVSKNATFK